MVSITRSRWIFEINKCSLDTISLKDFSHSKLDSAVTVTCIYYHGEKRLLCEALQMDESLVSRKESYIDQSSTKIVLVTLQKDPTIQVTYKPGKSLLRLQKK